MIHFYEFAIQPSYRYFKKFNGIALDEYGKRNEYEISALVKKRYLTQSDHFDHLDDDLLANASYRVEKHHDTLFYTVAERDLGRFISSRLAENETYVLNDGASVCQRKLQTRISFLSSENLDLLKQVFDEALQRFMVEGITCFQLPFDTYKQDVLSATPILYEKGINTAIFCERIEVLLKKNYAELSRELDLNDVVHRSIDLYLSYVRRFLSLNEGTAIICDFVPSEAESHFYQTTVESIPTRVCQIANDYLVSQVKMIPNARIFKISETVKHVGERESFDRKLFFIGKIPFSLALSKQFAFEIIGSVLERQGRTIRGIIVDLDHTLWGGIVGEDGMDQLALGPEFPGLAYVYFQKTLKAISARGVLLALCSKNTESVAMGVIEAHPHMVLRKNDFSSIRINWEHKSENIRAIASELSLGLKNLAFIDDSPTERAEIKKILPEILVPQFPDDICNLAEIFTTNPFFYSSVLTPEDLLRAERFQTTRQIAKIKNSEEDLIAFYYSLGMNAQLNALNDKNKERILVLIQKTNQFNTTALRYSEKDLNSIVSTGGHVYAIHYRDQLMKDGEDIGVVVTHPNNVMLDIKLFLMSCRYLNRTIETKVLSDLCHIAKKDGFEKLVGRFELTDRNSIVSNLYSKHAFVKVSDDLFEYSLNQSLSAPRWFKNEDQT
jgi:FkbH-like protein